jgi:dihydrofolate reductase
MAQLRLDISVSLDGFIAGPNRTTEEPLGEGGEQLHDWVFRLASWMEAHGIEGKGATGPDDDLVKEQMAQPGAVLMGRRMFSGGEGGWEDDPMAEGWWGDTPPFGMPVFVLTHHARETLTMKGGTSFVFVTDGVESAFEQARAAAGGKDVAVAGGATIVQQCLRAGLLDELQVHVAPVLLGDGVRLFDGGEQGKLELLRVVDSPTVTHVKYRVVREA